MNSRIKDFELGTFKHFYLVAYFKGFSKASRSSGLSQPALSTGVKNLERALGVRLFTRSSTEFGLTAEGSALFEFCQQMAGKWSDFQSGISSLQERSIQRVRLGSALSIGFSPVANLIKHLSSQKRAISVDVTTADSHTLVRGLQEGALDMAFLPDDVLGPDLEHKFVTSDSVILVAKAKLRSKGKINWLKLLASQSLVTYPLETPMRSLVDRFLIRENIRFNSEITVTGVEGIKTFVQQGLGTAFILRSLVESEIRKGSVAHIQIPFTLPKRGITLAYRRNNERIGQLVKTLNM